MAATDSEFALQAIQRAEAARSTMTYRTQQDAARFEEKTRARLQSATHTIFHTTTSSQDHLIGIKVRWVLAADRPTMPTLDADTGDGGAGLVYESVA